MARRNQSLKNRLLHSIIADQLVEVTFYTDPLCCWSWVWQPQLLQLQAALGDQASWDLKMGGLIPDWEHFKDEANSVVRPLQMGPVWMHAGQVAGRPICHQVWLLDPPATSYPACIAVKCAQLQSMQLGFAMLHALQTACMDGGRNIAKRNVLFEVADQLSDKNPLFNADQFTSDFNNGNGKNLFSADLDSVKKHTITRYPSMIVRSNGKSILISGYRDAVVVFNAIKSIAPELADMTLK